MTDSRPQADSSSQAGADAFVALLVQHRHSLYAFIAKQLVNPATVQRRSKLHFDAELVQLLAEEAAHECELTESRMAALRECMAGLSSRQQEILHRCYMGSDSITDVAKGLGRERTALYKQLARLKQKLLDCIQHRLVSGAAS